MTTTLDRIITPPPIEEDDDEPKDNPPIDDDDDDDDRDKRDKPKHRPRNRVTYSGAAGFLADVFGTV
jgi:hypothetical protein